MKHFPFLGNDEYLYDETTNILHYCKCLVDECNIDHLTPNNSYLIPKSSDNPELLVMCKSKTAPTRCPHCFKNSEE